MRDRCIYIKETVRRRSVFSIKRLFFISVITVALFSAAYSACNPVAAELCAAVDDIGDVWINGVYINQFDYVNWDEDGVYPQCVTFDASILAETDNVIAIKVLNTNCCEIWGSWSVETTCSDGSHSCITSDDVNMYLNYINDGDCAAEPAADTDGDVQEWYEPGYESGGLPAPWTGAIANADTIWGKQIYDPCDGHLLEPLSYAADGSAGTLDCKLLFMRQPFSMTPEPTPPPTEFTIEKSLIGPSTGYNTNDRITYQLIVCNHGDTTQEPVIIKDVYDTAFGFTGTNGTNWCHETSYGPCFQTIWDGGSNYLQISFPKGFGMMQCVTLTALVTDYWVDSSEYCDVRPNVAGVIWDDGGTPADASSTTVNVTMYCQPTNTHSNTFTPTDTFTVTYTPTITDTPTQTYTPTLTYTPTDTYTFTNTFTQTNTFTPTLTPTFTNSWTYTNTNTHTFTPTITQTPSDTPTGPPPSTWTDTYTATESYTPTNTFTFTRTYTNTYTYTNTHTFTATHTFSPTNTFTVNTFTPTDSHTPLPTGTDTNTPTETPTPLERISLAKSQSASEVLIGDTLTYCITFTNVGAVVADFTIWDTLPYEVDYLYSTNGGATNTSVEGNTVVYWNMTGVEVGAWGSVCVYVRIARFPITYLENRGKPEYAGITNGDIRKYIYAKLVREGPTITSRGSP